MRIHQRILLPVFGNKLALIFGRNSPKAIANFYQAVSHHKGRLVDFSVKYSFYLPSGFVGNTTLEVLYLAGKFSLLKTYIKHSPAPHTAESYTLWVRDCVKNEYFMFLNQLVFGCLEAYFIFKV